MAIVEKKKIFECEFEGKKIIFEVDKLGIKGNKSVVCRYEDTVVLTVLTIKNSVKEALPFFPLTVLFEERFYAVGRIPSSFGKREAKPSNFSVVAARTIDHSLRSFFPTRVEEIDHEVQITNLVLSVGKSNNPLLAALWGSFLVCFLSPELDYFDKCFASLIVGKKDKELIYHLSYEELTSLPLELVISATRDEIVMLEVEAAEIVEEELEKIIKVCHLKIKNLINFFQSMFLSLGVEKKKRVLKNNDPEITFEKKKILSFVREIIDAPDFSWWEKEKKMQYLQQSLVEEYCQTNPLTEKKKVEVHLNQLWDDLLQEENKERLKKNVRLDGRKEDEIRPLLIRINYLPNTVVHGNAFFQRGNTQVLSVVTFGKSSEKQLTDNFLLPFNFNKRFIHHYNFPGFSVNSITFSYLTRRVIGHGELVERTFNHLFPLLETFPYTIRVVSEVLSSDGSSSQASICATSLALISSGVPLKRPAAGIALGLSDNHILTDINAIEDRISEMDFKVAGTEKGICSIQLDIKDKGLDFSNLKESLVRAKQARLQILNEMKKHIVSQTLNPILPSSVLKWKKFYVGNDKMKILIGSGGRTINELTKRTGAFIETQSDGYLIVYHSLETELESVCFDIVKIINKDGGRR